MTISISAEIPGPATYPHWILAQLADHGIGSANVQKVEVEPADEVLVVYEYALNDDGEVARNDDESPQTIEPYAIEIEVPESLGILSEAGPGKEPPELRPLL